MINLLWCPLGSDKPNHFVPLIESYKLVKCNGIARELLLKHLLEHHQLVNTVKSQFLTISKRALMRIISPICKEVQDGVSSPTNAITCKASFGGDVEQSKCYNVGTFINQLCDAKADQGDVLSLKWI